MNRNSMAFTETRLVDNKRRCTYCAAEHTKVTASAVSRHFMSHVLEDIYDGPGRGSFLYDADRIHLAFDFMEQRVDLSCPRCGDAFMHPSSMEHHMHTIHMENYYKLPIMGFDREARDLLTWLGFQQMWTLNKNIDICAVLACTLAVVVQPIENGGG